MTGTAPNGEQFDRDKVLSRIKKMLNLANDAAASEGERDNALRMAHSTLAKFGLSMAEAERTGHAKQEERVQNDFVIVGYPWARTVVHAVCQLLFCEYIYVRTHPRYVKNYVIGRLSNVATAIEMSKFIIDNITREATRRQRELFTDGGWWRSFCKGAAHAVYVRCAKLRAEAEKASQSGADLKKQIDTVLKAPGTALVLADYYKAEQQANDELVKRLHPEAKLTGNRESRTQAGAFVEGRAHGNRINLNRQIGGGNDTRRIK